jgi:hypothetical protein
MTHHCIPRDLRFFLIENGQPDPPKTERKQQRFSLMETSGGHLATPSQPLLAGRRGSLNMELMRKAIGEEASNVAALNKAEGQPFASIKSKTGKTLDTVDPLVGKQKLMSKSFSDLTQPSNENLNKQQVNVSLLRKSIQIFSKSSRIFKKIM